MEKEFIPYEQALELKELGFDEPCFMQYDKNGLVENVFGRFRNSYFNLADQVSTPTFSQAFRWFRKEHYIHCEISETTDWEEDNESWTFIIYKYKLGDNDAMKRSITDYKTYEEAELACLQKLIEIVK